MKKNKEDDPILKELKRISKLLVMQVTQGQNQKEQVTTLIGSRFQPVDVAELLGIPTKSVHAYLAQIKKKSRPKKTSKVQQT